MKITFHPTKSAVLGRLAHQLKEVQLDLDESKKALEEEEKKASESKLHNPYQEQAILGFKARLGTLEAQEASLQDTIGFVESSQEVHVKAEIEI